VEQGAIGDIDGIFITTPSLSLDGGARIDAGTESQGTAGEILITAFDEITLRGQNSLGRPTAIAAESLSSDLAGDVTLTTGELSVLDQAEIVVGNQQGGPAGALTINATEVFLDQGTLSATTSANSISGNNGEINLEGLELLVLSNNSLITASALGQANGGNINIESVIVTLQNSQITANAVAGQGGNIQITASVLLLDQSSAITASSEVGVDGVVEVIDPEIDPIEIVVPLPTPLVDTREWVIRSCLSPSAAQRGRFVRVGTGGIPTQPGDLLAPDFELFSVPSRVEGWGEGDLSGAQGSSGAIGVAEPEPPKPIVEAQGIFPLEDGRLVLGRRCG
jgi:large exoprotein involved in heme utilization and adhesion